MKKQLRKRFEFAGDVPVDLYLKRLNSLTPEQLLDLKLRTESKKRNIDLTQKIYWGVIGSLTVGLLSTLIFSSRSVSQTYPYKLDNLIGNAILLVLGYLIMAITIQILIQHSHNNIYNHLELIKKIIHEKEL